MKKGNSCKEGHRSIEVRKTSLGLKIKGLKMVEEMGRVYVDMKEENNIY